ncbi:MAG: PhoH family protein [candidate division Zixibacteria bacterium]|nr:PhoH family protein [candidate division Zixibacteria bacterium]
MPIQTRKIELVGIDQRLLFGPSDVYLRLIEEKLPLKLVPRGETLVIEGQPALVDKAAVLFVDLIARLKAKQDITEQYILYSLTRIESNGLGPAGELEAQAVITSLTKEQVQPKTVGQKDYLAAMGTNDIVFAIGPAGTGKTFLAVARATADLKSGRVNRIILVRPAVEAGESLGFLPGDIRAKVDPYLRPVYDALHELLPAEKIQKLIEIGIIEIAPLAFMRGRTLNNCFVILDEGQNTTSAQMKMFLTRLGVGSKAVITGDITQIDLENKKASGLVTVQKILDGIKGVTFVYLTEKDVVRHRLVTDVIKAYERFEGRGR